MVSKVAAWAAYVLVSASTVAALSPALVQLPRRADSSCPTGTYTTPPGSNLTFDAHCDTDQDGWNLLSFPNGTQTFTTQETSFAACANRCASERPLCYGVSFHYDTGTCFFKNDTFTYRPRVATTTNNTHLGVARLSQLQPFDTACPYKNGTMQVVNGANFTIHCNQDIAFGDYCPRTSVDCLYHADSLEDCMNFCTTSESLCKGVAWNPDMQKGYGNCYPKNGISGNYTPRGPKDPQADVNGITHAAVLQLPNVTYSCTDNKVIRSSNGTSYTLDCLSDRPGNDLVSYHATSIDDCINTCTTYTKGNCVGVVLDTSMTNGFANCYLKNSFDAPTGDMPGYIAALKSTSSTTSSTTTSTSTSDSDSDSSGGGGGISGGAIAGIVVGVLAALVLLGLLGLLLLRRRRDRRRKEPEASESEKPVEQRAAVANNATHSNGSRRPPTAELGTNNGYVAPPPSVAYDASPPPVAYNAPPPSVAATSYASNEPFGGYSRDAKHAPADVPPTPVEMDGNAHGQDVPGAHEMPGSQVERHELAGSD